MILCLITFLLCGCHDNKKENYILNYMERIYYKDDEYAIYSNFTNLQIKIDNQIYTLKDAFEKNKITLEELINNMIWFADYNDGGSKAYKSSPEMEVNGEFYLAKCNTIHKNKNIVIGNTSNIVNYCQYN